MVPNSRILEQSRVVEERSLWGEAVPEGAVDRKEVSMPA